MVTAVAVSFLAATRRSLGVAGKESKYRDDVIARLDDADPRVQALAAESVARTCKDIASQVSDPLKKMLGSDSFEVRYQASLALLALGDTSGDETMLADQTTDNDTQKAQAKAAYDSIAAQK